MLIRYERAGMPVPQDTYRKFLFTMQCVLIIPFDCSLVQVLIAKLLPIH